MVIIAAFLIAIIFAQLGCVILWQRYAYFGDGLVHACIFSGSLSLLFHLPPIITVAITAILYGSLVQFISRGSEHNVAISTASSIMLALALIVNSLFGDINSLNQLLIGDILFTNKDELITLAIITIVTSILMTIFYKKIVLLSLSPELAQINGINVSLYKWCIIAFIGLVVTTIIPMVGGLLCTALLIIPAATARLMSNSPKQMIIIGIITAIFTNISGVFIAIHYNLPISPVILLVGSALYLTLHIDMMTINVVTVLMRKR